MEKAYREVAQLLVAVERRIERIAVELDHEGAQPIDALYCRLVDLRTIYEADLGIDGATDLAKGGSDSQQKNSSSDQK